MANVVRLGLTSNTLQMLVTVKWCLLGFNFRTRLQDTPNDPRCTTVSVIYHPVPRSLQAVHTAVWAGCDEPPKALPGAAGALSSHWDGRTLRPAA